MTALAVACAASSSAASAQLPHAEIAANDNRATAGVLRDGVLHVELETRMGVWYPEGRASIGLPVAAFAEVGRAPQNPGPVIRAQQGTPIVVVVHNRLAKTLTMRGLGPTRGLTADSVGIPAGASHRFEFVATSPGTFYYAGVTGRAQGFSRGSEDSQLNGAIIIGPPGARSVGDRVFLVSWWYRPDSTSPTGLERVTIAINGRSWPHTEPLHVTQGDSLRWRWINMTIINHPMHLHGFFFRVDAVGDGSRYTSYDAGARRTAVTERLGPGGTLEMAWSPSRPGNWLMHCHVATHMSHLVSIGTERGVPAAATTRASPGTRVDATGNAKGNAEDAPNARDAHHARDSHDAHPPHGMAGMVMAVHVAARHVGTRRLAARGAASPPPSRGRAMRLTVESRANVFGTQPGYRYRIGANDGAADSTFGAAGPLLVLQQDEPVSVSIVNRSHEPAAVHWHGIELESYADGVPGFSGAGRTVLPAIAPGDSLTVRFTPPRAGTFMYHSHFNEIGQISSGLAGAIVVLPRGQRWTPATDRVLLFSDDGPTRNILSGPFPATRVNGRVTADTLFLDRGVTYRLRMINIRTDYTLELALVRDQSPLTWTPAAKDGADLPAHQSVPGPARVVFGPGEIHDVLFTPTEPGTFALRHSIAEGPPPIRQPGAVTVVVR